MTHAAIAVVPPGGVTGALRGGRGIAVVARCRRGAARWGCGVGGAVGAARVGADRAVRGRRGKGPVGARRMMPVRASSGAGDRNGSGRGAPDDAGLLAGRRSEGGSGGRVTGSAGVGADADTALREPRQRDRCGRCRSSRTSKWQCGPVELPRLPMVAIWSPAITRWPTLTSQVLTWPYSVTVPSACRSLTQAP